jgi:hypothetical protein
MIPTILLTTNSTNDSDLLNIGSPQYAMRYTKGLVPPVLKQMKKLKHLGNKNTLNNLVQYSLHTGQDMNSALDNSIEADLAMELSGFKLKRKSNKNKKRSRKNKKRSSKLKKERSGKNKKRSGKNKKRSGKNKKRSGKNKKRNSKSNRKNRKSKKSKRN